MALIGQGTPIAQRFNEVTIQSVTDGTDGSGFPIEIATDLVTLQAARAPVRGAVEQFTEGQVSARTYDSWTMPYAAAIDPDLVGVAKMRLLYRGRAFDIVDVHVLNLRAEITMTTMVKAD
jgi:head-tail adaptor